MNGPLIIGGSAGSFRIISAMVSVLTPGFPFPIIVCVHRNRSGIPGFVSTLEYNSSVPIHEVRDRDNVRNGQVSVAPPNMHLEFSDRETFMLTQEPPLNYSRPSIDRTMFAGAAIFGAALTGILLTGANSDGAAGLKAIHDAGGVSVVQDPDDAEIPMMPQAALDLFQPAHILGADKIINFIENLTGTP